MFIFEFGFFSGLIIVIAFVAVLNSMLYARQLERRAQNERMTLLQQAKRDAAWIALILTIAAVAVYLKYFA